MIKKLWEKAILSWEVTATIPFFNWLFAQVLLFLAMFFENDAILIIGAILVYLIQVLIIVLAYHTVLHSNNSRHYTATIISTIWANIVLFMLILEGLAFLHLILHPMFESFLTIYI